MIGYTVKLSDGSKRKIECITSWEEMTFKQLLEIEKARKDLDEVKIFSILTNTNYEDLANITDGKILDSLEKSVRFIFDSPDWENLKAPKELILGEKRYKVPSNLNDIKFGQRVLLKQLASKEIIEEALPDAIAIMMVSEVYGEFNEETQDKIPELIKIVLEAKALEAYPVGQHFFLNLPILKSIGRSYLRKSQR